jgi:hypothetical protein
MKRYLQLELLLGFLIIGTGNSVLSQVTLPHYEGFEYTAGSTLQTQGGWTAINTGDDILIAEGSLSFPDYIASKGNKITFGGGGLDHNKSFTAESTDILYYSLILKVTDITAATSSVGGYFAGFGQTATLFGATLWLKQDGSKFRIGISSRTTASAVAYSTELFDLNSEILIVAAYQFNSEAGDDVASLWINPPSSSFGTSEVPTTTLSVTNAGGTDLSSISSFFIRQDSDEETPIMEVDELRISKTWENVVPLTAATDNTPPVFTSGYPAVANVDATQADLQVSMNEAGKAYYVVVHDGATAPTVEEVVAGFGNGYIMPVASGNIDVTAGGGTYSATITGLTDKTNYDIYVVAEDDEDTPNRQTETAKVDLYTIRPPDVMLFADFETAGSLAPFTQVSVTGDQVWIQTVNSGNGYAYMNGFSGGPTENEDWLISPLINLGASEMNVLSFLNAKNYTGPDLQVLVSTNFSGTYAAADIAAATWTDITSNFSFSTGGFAWTASGEYNLDSYSDGLYVAFKYVSSATASAAWEVDDFRVTGYLPQGSDATLSDLRVDGVSIPSFDPANTIYTYVLEAGVTDPPVITCTTTDPNATVDITNATNLAGEPAERTSSVVVTSADGNYYIAYHIMFDPIIAVADLSALRAVAPENYHRKYQVTGEVIVSGINDAQRHQKYVQDGSAGIIIDDNDAVITTAYSVGDGITGLTGSLTEYNNLLEFIPYRDPGTASSTGNTLTPQVVTVADFTASQENYESELVKIVGVKFTGANGTAAFQEKKNYTINVGSDETILRTIFLGTDLNDKIIPYMADVTGIATVYNADAQLAPRNYADLVVYSSDATLSDLKVSGTTVTGFAAGTLTYNVSLTAGTTTVPTVTATPAEANATVNITPATSLTGDAAARTTTVEVRSHDQSTVKTYTVVFSVATGIEDNLSGRFRIYPVPAQDEITAAGLEGATVIEIFDVTGNKVAAVRCDDETTVKIPLANFSRGLYFMRITTAEGFVMKRFVKE